MGSPDGNAAIRRRRSERRRGESDTRVAYLAGSSLAFARGSVRIYQTLASRAERGPPPVPATRADLYRPADPAKPNETLPPVSD